MVSFRVSPEEYRVLCQACATQGVRSVSELARAGVRLLITSSTVSMTFDDQLLELRARVHSLSTQLERLTRQLEV
jgi:hypothetical protein